MNKEMQDALNRAVEKLRAMSKDEVESLLEKHRD